MPPTQYVCAGWGFGYLSLLSGKLVGLAANDLLSFKGEQHVHVCTCACQNDVEHMYSTCYVLLNTCACVCRNDVQHMYVKATCIQTLDRHLMCVCSLCYLMQCIVYMFIQASLLCLQIGVIWCRKLLDDTSLVSLDSLAFFVSSSPLSSLCPLYLYNESVCTPEMLFVNVPLSAQFCIHSKWLTCFPFSYHSSDHFFWSSILQNALVYKYPMLCQGVCSTFTYPRCYDNSYAYFLVVIETASSPTSMCKVSRRWSEGGHIFLTCPAGKGGT